MKNDKAELIELFEKCIINHTNIISQSIVPKIKICDIPLADIELVNNIIELGFDVNLKNTDVYSPGLLFNFGTSPKLTLSKISHTLSIELPESEISIDNVKLEVNKSMDTLLTSGSRLLKRIAKRKMNLNNPELITVDGLFVDLKNRNIKLKEIGDMSGLIIDIEYGIKETKSYLTYDNNYLMSSYNLKYPLSKASQFSEYWSSENLESINNISYQIRKSTIDIYGYVLEFGEVFAYLSEDEGDRLTKLSSEQLKKDHKALLYEKLKEIK